MNFRGPLDAEGASWIFIVAAVAILLGVIVWLFW